MNIKKAAAALVLILITSSAAYSKIHLGFRMGKRTVFDENIRAVYGNGIVYLPFVRLTSSQSPMGLEFSYEGGYTRTAPIGLFQENSTLSVSGLEVSAFLTHRLGILTPYLKLGIGYYTYKQDIESEFIRQNVGNSEQVILAGGGLDIQLPRGFYITSEFKYMPWKITSDNREVNLGGYRFLAGIGYSFNFRSSKRVLDIE